MELSSRPQAKRRIPFLRDWGTTFLILGVLACLVYLGADFYHDQQVDLSFLLYVLFA
jgi:hypothetical protein